MTNSVEISMLAAIKKLAPPLRARAEAYPFPQLHNACLDGDLELITALLNAGLSPDMYPYTDDEDDVPPLVWIAEHFDGEIAQAKAVIDLLLKRGADIDEGCPLLAAAEQTKAEIVDYFVALGADVDEALDADPSPEAEGLTLKAQRSAKTSKAKGGRGQPVPRL